MGKVELWSGLGQAGPLQRPEIVSRKENLAHERTGEERIPAFERIQNKIRPGVFSAGKLIFSNSDDRRNFGRGSELSVRSDLNGFSAGPLHVSFNFPLVGLELDMLYPEIVLPLQSDEEVENSPHLCSRFPHAGFEACTLNIHNAICDTDLVADIVHGEIWF